MHSKRIALSAALLATTCLVPLGAAFAQETTTDDVITVRYQYVPDDKRVTSEVSSFLDVDDILTTGDSDIASALSRVTGVSVTDGRFVVEMRHSPEFTMFMVQRMQPRMRELLDDPSLDCFRCHLPREAP